MFSSVLPTKYFDSEWSFAQCRIVDGWAISAIKEEKLLVVTKGDNGGNYYEVDLTTTGGELTKKEIRGLLEAAV
jgi:hypothetical protein